MEIVGQGLKWGVKAVAGLVLNITLLTVWVEFIGLDPTIAIIPNWIILSIAGYIVVNWWVFADGDQPATVSGHVRRFVKSEAVMLSSKGLNIAVYWLLIFVTVPYQIAWVIGAGFTVLVSFGGNRHLWSPSDINMD